jgi:hypothetical protein
MGCTYASIPGPAPAIVDMAYEHYTAFGTQQVALAMQQVTAMRNIELTPINFAVHYTIDDDITAYRRPVGPSDPSLTWNDPGALPSPPEVSVSDIWLETAPAHPSNPLPVFDTHAQPGPLTATRPTDKPTLQPVTIPDAPELVLPPVPTLRELNLPDTPTLNLTPFTATRPNMSVAPPNHSFAFTPEQYADALLDKVKSRVSTMLDGDTGLPAAIAQALRDRAYAALDVQEQRAIQQAVEEFSSRGFSQPNGILARTLAEVRQNNQNQRSSLSRDIHIRDQELAVHNLKFAVTQGISLESTLMQNQIQFNQMLLEVARATQDTAIAIFNATVAGKQLELEAYKTDAEVWLDNLKGELAKLDQFKAEIEAQALIGQLNESDVRVYQARIDAVKAGADIYRSEVEGAKAVADANESIMRGWLADVQAYSEQVRAWGIEWDGYRAQLDGDSTKARIFELIEQAYATRISSWDTTQRLKIANQQSQIAVNGQRMAGWEAQLRKLTFDLEQERTKNTVLADIYRTKIAKYQADASVELAASDANARKLTLGIERERNRTSTELENARLKISQSEQLTQQLISINEIITRTLTQLAASALSAVNYSASVSGSYSTGSGCSTSYNYSMQQP